MDHPGTHLLVGLILIVTGALEAYDHIAEESRGFRVAAHHGIIILGLFQVLQSLPHLIEGLERWFQAFEKGERPETRPPSQPPTAGSAHPETGAEAHPRDG
jgi:hypothetical protein